MNDKDNTQNESVQSADSTLTRKEFVSRIAKAAALAGGALAAPKVFDKFLVPPAYAATSTGCNQPDSTGPNTNNDIADGTFAPLVQCINVPGRYTVCVAGSDVQCNN